jgi:hypothetical protein
LDITGNAKIDGNLTLGGNITIGDNTSDSVNVVASLSSSLIPQTTNIFDLGSATKFWRDLYISTGSIKMVNPANNQVVTTITAVAGGGIQIGNVQISTSSIAFVDNSGNITQNVAQSSSVGSTSNFTTTSSFNSFTSSIDTTIKTKINTDGVISGSSQILGGSGIVTGSSQITYANISSIPAGIVSGSSQVTGIGNAQLTNSSITIAGTSTALGSSITSDQIRSAIGTLFSGSSQVNYTSITGIPGGIVSSSLQTIANLPTGVVSGSTQVTPLLPTGTVSGSSQVTISSTTGYGTIINQALLTTSAVTHGNLTINGTITATGDITAFFTSDKRHKNNIQIIPNALDKVSKLNGVTWEWNDDVNEVTKSTPKTGLIAQEVQEVLPEVIKTREDGFLALDYSKMMGLLVEAIKEQQKQIEELKAQIGS